MKAIALFSGGLDSCLSIKIIQNMGVEVEAVYIETGFDSNFEKQTYLQNRADELGVKFTFIDERDNFIKNILFSPKYGYGKNLNPCIDCHANMINVAHNYMQKAKAKFIISGEVLGQRPMSQKLDGLKKIEKLVTAPEIVVRPLSAKLLPPTLPELNGWIEREKMFAISGRERKTQIELAKKFGIKNYESPAGGCLLTDKNFTIKLKNLTSKHNLCVNEIDILKVGRHLKINETIVIISRKKEENSVLKSYNSNKFIKMYPIDIPGPIGLIEKEATTQTKQIASQIMLTYTKAKEGKIKIGQEYFTATSLNSKDEIRKYMIL